MQFLLLSCTQLANLLPMASPDCFKAGEQVGMALLLLGSHPLLGPTHTSETILPPPGRFELRSPHSPGWSKN